MRLSEVGTKLVQLSEVDSMLEARIDQASGSCVIRAESGSPKLDAFRTLAA